MVLLRRASVVQIVRACTAGGLHYGFPVGRMGPDDVVDDTIPANTGVR
jgi:hypothetical protein